ncbi:SNAP receptor use1 [Trebouxia sp. C0010 RCD-2024]
MALPSADLPQPKSGSYSELSFRRLLKSCDEIAAGDAKGRQDLEDWQHSPVFFQYVDSLAGHLTELENRVSKKVAPETLTQYQAHVKRLKDTLAQPNEAAFARENSHTDSADAAGVVGRVQAELVGEAASHAQNNASAAPVPHRPLLQPAVPNSTRADGSGAAEASGPAVLRQRGQRPPQDTALSKAAQAKLQMHENLQDSVSDDMVGLSGRLLANVRAMQGAVESREGLLNQAEAAQDVSATNASYAVKTSKNIKNRGAVGLCVKLAILVAVGCTVPAMYIFIRSTYFLGYKAR